MNKTTFLLDDLPAVNGSSRYSLAPCLTPVPKQGI